MPQSPLLSLFSLHRSGSGGNKQQEGEGGGGKDHADTEGFNKGVTGTHPHIVMRPLTLQIWMDHSHIPMTGDVDDLIPWINQEGYDPDMTGCVQELDRFSHMTDLEDVFAFYGVTPASVANYDRRMDKLTSALMIIEAFCIVNHVPIPQTNNDASILCTMVSQQVKRHESLFKTVELLSMDPNVVQLAGPLEEEEEDDERRRKKPMSKRVHDVVCKLSRAEGLAKSVDGTVAEPVYVDFRGMKMYAMCYRTMEDNTNGTMEGLVRRAVEMWLQKHPMCGLTKVDEIDLSDIEGNNGAVTAAADWLKHPRHSGNIPLAQINRFMLSVLVDGEPHVLYLGRQPVRTDANPQTVAWPSVTPVSRFNAADFCVEEADRTRMLLDYPVRLEWLDVFNKVAQGLHNHTYPDFEVEWHTPSMRELKDAATSHGPMWKETPTSDPHNPTYVNTSPEAVAFREAEMLMVRLVAPLTPAFNKLLRDQGYSERSTALALMTVFGVGTGPTQFRVPGGLTEEWQRNHGSQRAVYVYGVSGSGKSQLCDVLKRCYQKHYIHNVSCNNQDSRYCNIKNSTHVCIAAELGDAKTFADTHAKTDWLSMTECETLTLRVKTENHTVYRNPDQPVMFFGSDAPFSEDEQWLRRFTFLHFGRIIPPGQRSADMSTQMMKELAQLIILGSGWLCYNRYIYTKDEQSEPIVHYLTKQFQGFRAAYMQRGNPLAAFLLNDEVFEGCDTGEYVRVDRFRILYNAWMEEQNDRSARRISCTEGNLLPLCNANGMVLRTMTAAERQVEQVAGNSRILVIQNIREK